MSTILRRLLSQPDGAIAAKAFCDFHNYVLPGLMAEEDVKGRILKSIHTDTPQAIAAIHRGFAAARRKLS